MSSINDELKKCILKIKSDMNNLKNINYKLINEHLDLKIQLKQIKNHIDLKNSTIKELQDNINELE